MSHFPVFVVQFDMLESDASEGDGIVTLEIKKTEKIDFDFDVIIIPVPLTAGELNVDNIYACMYVCMYVCIYVCVCVCMCA